MKPPHFPGVGAARVRVFGGTNMDVWAQAQSPLIPLDSTPGRIECSAGGVARNVAENLARLGIDTHLHSVVGDDAFGERLKLATRNAGVKTSGVVTLPGYRTGSYLSLHGPDGDMAYAVNDMDILHALTPDVLQHHEAVIGDADCWVVDCNLSPATLKWLMDRPRRPVIFADAVSVAKCARLAPWLNQIHTLKANRLEAQALSGLAIDDVAQAQTAARALHQKGATNALVSLGEAGICWCDAQGQSGHLPAGHVKVVSTTGAGDALLAGQVLGHLAGLPMLQSVEVAMACAALTLGSPYANAPDLSIEAVYSRVTSAFMA